MINCDKEIHSLSREEDVTYLNLDPSDITSESLQNAFDFIETAINSNKNVTVLCQSGNFKSATIIAYYLMRKCQISPFKSVDLVKQIRPKTRLNATLNALLSREAKRYGLLKATDSGSSSKMNTGIYFVIVVVAFFGLLYFSLNMLTKSPPPPSRRKY